MAFRLVSSGGAVSDPAFVNMLASGTIHPGEVVDFSLTSAQGVVPASMSSTVTTIFGVSLDYAQGASDTMVRVIPFTQGQIWEADCLAAGATASVGLRFALSRTRADLALNNVPQASDATTATAVFRVMAISNTSASGKVLGYFRRGEIGGTPASTTDGVFSY